MVIVAESNVQTAIAQLAEAKANVGKYQAEVVRWESEVRRLTQMVAGKVVDQQVLDETQKQLDSSKAARDAAQAAVAAREADRLPAEADLARPGSTWKPPRPKSRSPRPTSAGGRHAGLYEGHRPLRRRGDGPQRQHRRLRAGGHRRQIDAQPLGHVRGAPAPTWCGSSWTCPRRTPATSQKGTKAACAPKRSSGLEIPATVTRTSWAIREKTRTLRAEIDLSMQGLRRLAARHVRLRQGDHPAAQRLRAAAAGLMVSGNQTYCYLFEDGKAVKTPVEPGLSDGTWVEVDQMKIGDPGSRSPATNR